MKANSARNQRPRKASTIIYFFLSAWAGGIQQILQSDWSRERAGFSHPAGSRREESTFIKKCFNFLWKPFKWIYSYYVSKNLSVKPLSSIRIISVFIIVCSIEIVQFVASLAMITALKCSGLSHAFRCIVEKNKNVIHQPKSVRIGKNCALCLEYPPRPYPRPRGQFLPIRSSRLVITYIWCKIMLYILEIHWDQGCRNGGRTRFPTVGPVLEIVVEGIS